MMSAFGQLMTPRERSELLQDIQTELVRILRRWAREQGGELSTYQSGPMRWYEVVKALDGTSKGRLLARRFVRVRTAYKRAGDTQHVRDMDNNLRSTWTEARKVYRYQANQSDSTGSRYDDGLNYNRSAFGNLSGLGSLGYGDDFHEQQARSFAQKFHALSQKVLGRKPTPGEMLSRAVHAGGYAASWEALRPDARFKLLESVHPDLHRALLDTYNKAH